ncbi:restriction endonuclease subunit S, partial [Helicobacter turcicus]
MQTKELLRFLKYEKVEYKPLCEICHLRAGDRIIKSMMNANEKYPVIGGGVVPTGYFKDYNFLKGITIARAGSAGFVSWQENPFWATDVCFVATLCEFCHSDFAPCDSKHCEEPPAPCHSEALAEESLKDSKVRDISASPQYDKRALPRAICEDFTLTSKYDNLNLKFIFYFLKSRQNDLQKHLYGASMPKLDKGYLWNFPIPLPPLEVQNAIVAILDKFTELE